MCSVIIMISGASPDSAVRPASWLHLANASRACVRCAESRLSSALICTTTSDILPPKSQHQTPPTELPGFFKLESRCRWSAAKSPAEQVAGHHVVRLTHCAALHKKARRLPTVTGIRLSGDELTRQRPDWLHGPLPWLDPAPLPGSEPGAAPSPRPRLGHRRPRSRPRR